MTFSLGTLLLTNACSYLAGLSLALWVLWIKGRA
jgi:hypothetical protein